MLRRVAKLTCVLLCVIGLFCFAQGVQAQENPDCITSYPSEGWLHQGNLMNNSTETVVLSICYDKKGQLNTGESSDKSRWDVEGLWSLNRAGGGYRVYKLGFGDWHTYSSSTLLPGYIFVGGTARCSSCGWELTAPTEWQRGSDPGYIVLVNNALHCNAVGDNCVWAKDDTPPLVALYDLPDYKIPVADATTISRFGPADPRQPESIRMKDGYYAILYKDATQSSPWICVQGFSSNLNAYRYSDGTTVGGHVGVVQVGQGLCPQPTSPQPSTNPSDPPPSNPQNPRERLILYTEKDYHNPYYELETGAWDVENREYRSISSPSGWSFVLEETGGHRSCFNQSLHNLTDHESWQFKIDFIEVYSYNACQSNGGSSQPEPLGDWFIRLWTNWNYQGSSLKVQFTGDERYFWLNSVRLPSWNFNDDFESLELNEQRSVALYEHDSLQGGGKCFYDNDSDLSNDQFSNSLTIANQVSSFRFFVGDTCTLTPLTPQDLWTHAADKTKVILTWPLSSPNADGFYVYKIDSNGNATRIAQLSDEQAKQNAAALSLEWYIRSWTFSAVTCGESYTFAVSAYSDNGESGRTRQITANTPPCDCNDRTYSGVGLYDQKYCQGDFMQLTIPGWYVLNTFNDRASSIYVKPGWSVEVFENSNNVDGLTNCFGESKWDLTFDNYWIEPKAVEGTLSNVRVWDVPNCGRSLTLVGCDAISTDKVTLFDYTHCLGIDKSLNGLGFYTLGSFDDVTSSIFVPAGKSARLYENENKEGNFLCVRETKWDMKYDPYWWDSSKNTFNNVSAIQVFDDALCGGVAQPILLYPTNVHTVTDQDNLTFVWENVYAGGYWGELWGPNGFFKPSGHLQRNEWYIGTLEPGNYTWRVRGEVYAQLGEWSEVQFKVIDTTPTPDPMVNYSLDPNLVNRVAFSVTNCSGSWVYVVFGHDDLSADAPCVNGQSTAQHDYPYFGNAVTYYPVVAGIKLTLNLPGQKDCKELKPSTGVSLFADKNCRGGSRSFTAAGWHTLSDFNDQTSSIYPADGWSVEVFEHSNSSDGHAFCVTNAKWDLSLDAYYVAQGLMMDNTISNIRVYADDSCGKKLPQYGGCDANINYNGVVLFDYIHCGGSELTFDKAGRYELGYGAPFNDLASSAHVAAGWSVKVYENSGWTGASSCFTNDMWDLSIDKYWGTNKFVGNTISSAEVFKNSTCKPDTPPPPVKPAAPSNLQPAGGTFEVNSIQTFSWQGSGDSFIVAFTGGNTTYTLTSTVQSLQFGAPEVGSHSWKVKAVKDGLESDWSQSAVFSVKKTEDQPTPTKPAAPTNLRQRDVTRNSLTIEWDDNSADETGLAVKRWDGQKYVEVARVDVGVTTYTDANLKCGTIYKYTVTAFNATGESTPSPELQLSTNKCDDTTPSNMFYLPWVQR